MELGKAVIVAGIGSRRGVSAAEVVAAVEAALKEHGLERAALNMLATAKVKQDEAGIIAASGTMNLPLVLVDDDVLAEVATITRSQASIAAAGTPSVSEAAALAAAGDGARLAAPRIALGRVTCAIAFGAEA